MTDTPLPAASFGQNDFRIGGVFSRTFSVFSRNFLTFGLIALLANLPGVAINLLVGTPRPGTAPLVLVGLTAVLFLVLAQVSMAAIVYGAFQDMAGRPVHLLDSVQVGLRRSFSVLVVAILSPFLAVLAAIFFVVPGVILFLMWFVAIPACVVERLGPIKSLGRSRQLTKGHRWKLLGLILLVFALLLVISFVLFATLGALGIGAFVGGAGRVAGAVISLAIGLIWQVVWGTLYAIFVVVTYHDLRVAKEGVNTEQIVAVFD